MSFNNDTIVAQATAQGKGSVGIVRASGPDVKAVAELILGKIPKPRQAEYLPFYDEQGVVIDQGIALLFTNPNSFTGEDVIEFQGHGGQVVMELLLKTALTLTNVRLAKPGEFSERAFLNDKLDLAQAEAVADLIEASSEQAARSAVRSLQGVFSQQVNQLVEQVTYLRMYVEAAIDFPEEEIDFLSDGKVQTDLTAIIQQLHQIQQKATQGSILRDGMRVVIAGRPNAGKSSLLNALAGRDAAIVTDIAGTTRDVLKEHIHIDGMPLHIIDTAGLRESDDKVEQIGIERAWQEIAQADQVLLVVDSTTTAMLTAEQLWPEFMQKLPTNVGVTIIRNKADTSGETIGSNTVDGVTTIHLSASQQQGIDLLASHLKASMGYESGNEGQIIARRRHLDALDKASNHINNGQYQLQTFNAGELLAEELRISQHHLSEITGEFTSDDLLGKIFGSFCIGK